MKKKLNYMLHQLSRKHSGHLEFMKLDRNIQIFKLLYIECPQTPIFYIDTADLLRVFYTWNITESGVSPQWIYQ